MRILLFALIFGLSPYSQAMIAGDCPPPTLQLGTNCVLTKDEVIGQVIELTSFTTLDCRGHRLLPALAGSGAAPSSYVASSPEMAIFISGELGVVVRNCVIGSEDERFDFGVMAINSKSAGNRGHRIVNNEIHAREAGVTLMRVDDASVTNNLITWTNGAGIRIRRDSDRNRLVSNVLSSPGAPSALSRIVPGGSFFANVDDAIVAGVFQLEVLYNIVIDGRLYQFPNFEDGAYPAQELNTIVGNVASLPGPSTGKSHTGVLIATNGKDTRVIGNTISAAGVGIRFAGLREQQPVSRVAHCQSFSGASTDRFCVSDADCFIPDVDIEPIGYCPELQQDVVDLRASGTIVDGNWLNGPFNSPNTVQRSAIFAGAGTLGGIIRGNRVLGTGIEAGIALNGNSIESAVIVENIVRNAAVGLLLNQINPQISFSACFAFNDIIASQFRAVGVVGQYTTPTELSCEGNGNYWGHSSPPCFAESDSPNSNLIRDSYASCTPVAFP